MIRKIFFTVAVIFAMFNIAAAQTVSAYSIDLSIERKEICVSDIPADRKVRLAISIYNNPETDQLGLAISKDPALEFKPFVPITDMDPAFGDNITCGSISDNTNITFLTCLCVSGKYSGNNILGYVNLMLPEGAAPGNFYPVDLVNGDDLYIYYYNESGNRDYLLADNFNLHNGGIQINADSQTQTPAPPPHDSPQTPAPDPVPAQQQPDNPGINAPLQTAAPVDNVKKSETTSSSLTDSVSSVSSFLSEKKTSQKSSSLSSSKKSSDTSKVSSTETEESDSETTSVSKDKNTNTKSKIGIMPFIAAAVVLAAAAAIIIIRIKRKKK